MQLFNSLGKNPSILFEQLLMQIPVGRKTEEHGVAPRIKNIVPEQCISKAEFSVPDL